uniref:Uncharacterized protein n=1 Tax=Panagrolaimus superbus TaxID=310955 RepID=A0A914YMV5_9BILA
MVPTKTHIFDPVKKVLMALDKSGSEHDLKSIKWILQDFNDATYIPQSIKQLFKRLDNAIWSSGGGGKL